MHTHTHTSVPCTCMCTHALTCTSARTYMCTRLTPVHSTMHSTQAHSHVCTLGVQACTHHTHSTHACVLMPTLTHMPTHMYSQPCTRLESEPQALTLSLGSRLMVLRGRRTRRTLRDLMVLMSFPLDPLEGRSHICRQAGRTPVPLP